MPSPISPVTVTTTHMTKINVDTVSCAVTNAPTLMGGEASLTCEANGYYPISLDGRLTLRAVVYGRNSIKNLVATKLCLGVGPTAECSILGTVPSPSSSPIAMARVSIYQAVQTSTKSGLSSDDVALVSTLVLVAVWFICYLFAAPIMSAKTRWQRASNRVFEMRMLRWTRDSRALRFVLAPVVFLLIVFDYTSALLSETKRALTAPSRF